MGVKIRKNIFLVYSVVLSLILLPVSIADDSGNVKNKFIGGGEIEFGDFGKVGVIENKLLKEKEEKIIILFTGNASELVTTENDVKIENKVFDDVNEKGRAKVIVKLRDNFDEKTLNKLPINENLEERKKIIKRNQDQVLNSLVLSSQSLYYDFELQHKYSLINYLSGWVTKIGLEKLKNDPRIDRIIADKKVHELLIESVPLIKADTVQENGLDGSGVSVCVIDSGIDSSHPSLAGKVIAEKCFCDELIGGCCPDGTNEDNNATDDRGHGTHVAGIVTSGHATYTGVSPGSSLVAVKVLDSEGDGRVSDLVSGIDWCVDNRNNFDIKVITISIGGEEKYTENCPGPGADAIEVADAAGIFVPVASGNDGYSDGISSPACAEFAVSVGSVWDETGYLSDCPGGGSEFSAPDKVNCFSNIDDILDLMAPGAVITSLMSNVNTVCNNLCSCSGAFADCMGTSQATPHVAGLAALMYQVDPDIRPSVIESKMKQTGKLVSRDGLTFPRIDAFQAVKSVCTIDNDTDNYYAQLCGGLDCNDNNANINPGVAELCGDGIDNNCNGQIDEGCGGPGCTDDCTAGQTRCNGNYVQTCGDYDGNGCTEWGSNQFCIDGCSNNRCNAPPDCNTGDFQNCGEARPMIDGETVYDLCTGGDMYFKISTTQICDIKWTLTPDPNADYELISSPGSGQCPTGGTGDCNPDHGFGQISTCTFTQRTPGTYKALASKFGGLLGVMYNMNVRLLNCRDPCLNVGQPCSTGEQGVCSQGTIECVNYAEQCVGNTDPSNEVCDSLDNDCDGAIDEDLGTSSCGVGGCYQEVNNCENGVSQTCVPGQPSQELCDSLDNDCDGSIDEECTELVGYWNLNENSGLTAYDSSGYENHGNLTNGPIWTGGINGSALFFDGANDYVLVPNNLVFNVSNLTISAWVKVNANDNKYHFIAGKALAGKGFNLLHFPNNKFRFELPGASVDSLTTPNPGEWYLVTSTYDRNHMKIYVNGTLENVTPHSDPLQHSSVDLLIGAWQGAYNFNGTIDEVKLYSRSLNDSEVLAEYGKYIQNIQYYCDDDLDGYYDSSVDGSCTSPGCVPVGCQETQGNDCNDNNDSVYPSATEIDCDGIDQDCSGADFCPCDAACQASNPGGYVGYLFEHDRFSKFEVIFNWSDTPQMYNTGIYPAMLHFWFEVGEGGYTGPQIEVFNSGSTVVKKVIFTIWGYHGPHSHAYSDECVDVIGGLEGNHTTCIIHNNPSQPQGYINDTIWEEGKEYKITVQKDVVLGDGVVWNATIQDIETGNQRLIGRIKLDNQAHYQGYGLLRRNTGGFFEYYLGTHNQCLDAEYGKIIRKGPIADDMWLPKRGLASSPKCYRSDRNSNEPGVIIEEVGEGVFRNVSILPGEDWETKILWDLPQDPIIAASLNINLTEGWNLISLPLLLENSSLPTALASIEGNYNVVFAYINGAWKSYNPDRPGFLNTLTEISPEFGYWIKMNNSDSLEINGTIWNLVIDLINGWNLIGYPSLEEKNTTVVFEAINDQLEVIFMYDAFDVGQEWKSYNPDRPVFLNTLTTVEPGYGYWVKVDQDTNLVIS